MAGNTQVKEAYSTYTNIPAQRDGYDVVETKEIKQVPASTVGYTDSIGPPSEIEPLKEYGRTPPMSGGPKYAPKNPYDDYKPNYRVNYVNSSPPVGPNKYTHVYFSKESNKVHLGPGYVKTGSISGPNKSWQVAGPPAAHHPLTKPTNDIDEAFSFLKESVYYSPGVDRRRRDQMHDNLPTYVPFEVERRNYRHKQFGYMHPHHHAFVPKLQGPFY